MIAVYLFITLSYLRTKRGYLANDNNGNGKHGGAIGYSNNEDQVVIGKVIDLGVKFFSCLRILYGFGMEY